MGCNGDCSSCSEKSKNCNTDLREKPNRYSSVKKIIGVVSGKGGVGKSMVTALLASTMQKRGYKCGILDADITGPSIPKMFGIHGQARGTEEGLFPSSSKKGMKVMSSQLLLERETDPVVWRGPVIAGLVRQFWTDVIWDGIDYLFVDMPPGTGDVPLTVFQSIGVDGIVIVTSPQQLVSMIVEKAVKMAEMMKIEVLGIVENMSYVECGDCGKKIEVFGHSNIDEVAKRHKVEVLDRMPIDSRLSTLSDQGDIESFDKDLLKNTCDKLEALPVNVLNVAVLMNKDGEVSSFEKEANLNVYSTVKRMVISGKGFNAITDLAGLLKECKVHVLIAKELNNQLKQELEKAGILLRDSYSGPAQSVLRDYLVGSEEKEDEATSKCDGCDGDCSSCNK
jgi:Mrp family chromosome partitioning ATPase